MDQFIVSARKYRPQHFNTVVGQSHITSTLKNAIQSKQLAQAYLFCGPRGVGKTTCARIFAKTINCSQIRPDGEACDQCESCLSFNSGASLNVYELDAASNNSVDDIRNLVDQVRIAPQLGDYKVYIIDEVHMLSAAAFNAFLKTLEEPPRHAKFILATTEKHKIIPTILSRCQVFNFNRIKVEDISGHLAFLAKSEQVTFEPDALHIIAQKADGGLRDACSIFDQMVAFTGNNLTYKAVVDNLNVLDYDYYFKLTDAILGQRIPEIMLTFDDILRRGFDGHHFITGLGEHLRNLLVSKDAQTVVLLEVGDALRKRYIEQAQNCQVNFLVKALNFISRTDINYRNARNQRLLVEMTLLQLSQMTASPEAEKKNDIAEVSVNNTKTSLPAKPVQEEQPIRQATAPTINLEQLRLKSTFSIQEARVMSGAVQAVAEKEVQKEEDKPVTEEEVIAFVRRYAKESSIRQMGILFGSNPLRYERNTIFVTIQNETQRELLGGFRQTFIDGVRSGLKNYAIGLEVEMTQSDAPQKAYKPADIFKEMAEKNPALTELRKRFDLEIDY
jgi:DNA polymerase-3 subunit gamma/tau